ncbi:MAG: glycosyltransferase, partial [Candidatus Babeliales bacterium]
MMNSMRILIVHPSLLFFGGAEAVVVHLAHALKRFGAEVSILTSAVSDDIKTQCRDIPLIFPDKKASFHFNNPGFFSGLCYFAAQVLVLRGLLKTHGSKFDIIHVHNFPATWAVALAGIKRRAVWMCNEPPELWNREQPSLLFRLAYFFGFHVDRLLVRRSIAKICVSDEINGKRARLRYGLEPEITPYGIDGVFFADTAQDDPAVFKKFGLPDGFMLVQVGTVTPQKNQK